MLAYNKQLFIFGGGKVSVSNRWHLFPDVWVQRDVPRCKFVQLKAKLVGYVA